MRQLKFFEKILMFLLSVVFITTFFFSHVFSIKTVDEDPRFLIVSIIIFSINIGVFFWMIKILKRHYNYQNHKGIRIFFYSIIVPPAMALVAYFASLNKYPYILVYVFIISMYAYLINKEFGRLSIKIKRDHDGELFAGDLYTFNGDIKVRGKNKKMKGGAERIAIGDVIIISRDSEPIITLNVIKNDKKT